MTDPGQGASVVENLGEVALHRLGCDSREAECEGRRATVTRGSFKSPALRQPQAPLHWTVCHVQLGMWNNSLSFRSGGSDMVTIAASSPRFLSYTHVHIHTQIIFITRC